MALKRRVTGNSRIGFGRGLALAVLLIGLALVWTAYELGRSRAGYSRFDAQQRESALQNELLASQAETAELRERLALVETNGKIKEEAYRQVEERLADLQARIQQQSEDLAFYRGIVSADQQSGLRVQDLNVQAGPDPGAYSVRLVLAQALRNDKRITGKMELVVEGEQAGQPQALNLKELTGSSAASMNFGFRYFQNLQADVTIPEDFVPARVTIRLRPSGSSGKDVEESFDWVVTPG